MTRTESSVTMSLRELQQLEAERVIAEAEARAARIMAQQAAAEEAERRARQAEADAAAAREAGVRELEVRRHRERMFAEVRIAEASLRAEAEAHAKLAATRSALELERQALTPARLRLLVVIAGVLGALAIALGVIYWMQARHTAAAKASTRAQVRALEQRAAAARQAMRDQANAFAAKVAGLPPLPTTPVVTPIVRPVIRPLAHPVVRPIKPPVVDLTITGDGVLPESGK